MGGSPCLDDDLKNIEADIYISANEHGAKRRKVDYVVQMDEIHTVKRVRMEPYLRQFTDAPIVNPWMWGDYQMFRWPLYPRLMNSGVLASWIGYLVGGHPVILAGFDCYGGDPRILKMHEQYVPHVKAQVRVASGPLLKFYKRYDAKEIFPAYNMPEVLGDAMAGQVKVRVNADFEINGVMWPIGSILTVSAYEFRRQIKHKTLIEVNMSKNTEVNASEQEQVEAVQEGEQAEQNQAPQESQGEQEQGKKPVKLKKGEVRVRVRAPVLGYKVGDEFVANEFDIRRQIKHKSLIVI